MKQKLIKLLGLKTDASEAEILDAVTALKTQIASLTKTSDRETQISELVTLTGMQRSDAEHTIDQQAKENQLRANRPAARDEATPAWTTRQLNPHGL